MGEDKYWYLDENMRRVAEHLDEEVAERRQTIEDRLTKLYTTTLAGITGKSATELHNVATEDVKAFSEIHVQRPSIMGRIKVNNGTGEATSRKLDNITLRLGDLLMAIGGVLTSGEGVSRIYALLQLLTFLVRGVHVKLQAQDAQVIIAMWNHRDAQNRVDEDTVKAALLGQNVQPHISKEEYETALTNLFRLRCVERCLENPDRFKILESVTVDYPY